MLPAGDRIGHFGDVGYALFWSSSEYNAVNAWFHFLRLGHVELYRDYGRKKCGFSVRCLKDGP